MSQVDQNYYKVKNVARSYPLSDFSSVLDLFMQRKIVAEHIMNGKKNDKELLEHFNYLSEQLRNFLNL